jgi:N-acetylglucosamine kinase
MDSPDWREQLAGLFRAASDLEPQSRFAVLGLPGYGEVRRLDALAAAAAADFFPGRRRVVNDVEMALDGAFLDVTGILILAGTGSMAMARDGRGEVVRVGGWGDAFGDEGSGFWIGREALARTSRALDGRIEAGEFAAGILATLGLDARDGHDALMGWCYALSERRSGIAAVARHVDQLAESGDATALAILREAAEHLSDHMTAIRRHLANADASPWSYAGRVFDSLIMRRSLAARHGEPLPPRLSPIGGGLWRAASEAGWTIDDNWVRRLGENLDRRRQAAAAFPPVSSPSNS